MPGCGRTGVSVRWLPCALWKTNGDSITAFVDTDTPLVIRYYCEDDPLPRAGAVTSRYYGETEELLEKIVGT
jgi:hypothetical protein